VSHVTFENGLDIESVSNVSEFLKDGNEKFYASVGIAVPSASKLVT
jgi:hypothetical protein